MNKERPPIPEVGPETSSLPAAVEKAGSYAGYFALSALVLMV